MPIPVEPNMLALETAYERILCEILSEPLPSYGVPVGPLPDGMIETPARAAKAMVEMTAGYHVDIEGIFKTFDAEEYDELILERSIPFSSLCEHHLLPFVGVAHVGYIADGQIVGLSKLARLVEAYARRFQVQERMTQQIADAIESHLSPVGVIVVIEATHLCMELRGVRKPGVVTKTSVLRGLLKDDPAARAEAMSLIHS